MRDSNRDFFSGFCARSFPFTPLNPDNTTPIFHRDLRSDHVLPFRS